VYPIEEFDNDRMKVCRLSFRLMVGTIKLLQKATGQQTESLICSSNIISHWSYWN